MRMVKFEGVYGTGDEIKYAPIYINPDMVMVIEPATNTNTMIIMTGQVSIRVRESIMAVVKRCLAGTWEGD